MDTESGCQVIITITTTIIIMLNFMVQSRSRILTMEVFFFLFSHAAAAAKSLQLCPTLCDCIDGSPPGSCLCDSPGRNTGVGCHFLLQCMKVKSESEVAQSCPTLSNSMDCSLPGSSVRGIVQARVLEWVPLPSPTPALLCPIPPLVLTSLRPGESHFETSLNSLEL